TGVEEATHAAVFTLMQNYPNPFNPRTVIRFSVPTQSGRDGQRPALSGVQESGASDVKLTVSDILGKEVAVLLHERKAPGTYQVEFDASGLASGTYIYRLTAGSYVEARRMSLIK
ncbi:MAG: peptidase and subtilisin kexin sedolisin, partial [Bacteroidetes bacterium]|nr:peptidase and subtilisin kexin sedolisin [Bacteroidota bacterium]